MSIFNLIASHYPKKKEIFHAVNIFTIVLKSNKNCIKCYKFILCSLLRILFLHFFSYEIWAPYLVQCKRIHISTVLKNAYKLELLWLSCDCGWVCVSVFFKGKRTSKIVCRTLFSVSLINTRTQWMKMVIYKLRGNDDKTLCWIDHLVRFHRISNTEVDMYWYSGHSSFDRTYFVEVWIDTSLMWVLIRARLWIKN